MSNADEASSVLKRQLELAFAQISRPKTRPGGLDRARRSSEMVGLPFWFGCARRSGLLVAANTIVGRRPNKPLLVQRTSNGNLAFGRATFGSTSVECVRCVFEIYV